MRSVATALLPRRAAWRGPRRTALYEVLRMQGGLRRVVPGVIRVGGRSRQPGPLTPTGTVALWQQHYAHGQPLICAMLL